MQAYISPVNIEGIIVSISQTIEKQRKNRNGGSIVFRHKELLLNTSTLPEAPWYVPIQIPEALFSDVSNQSLSSGDKVVLNISIGSNRSFTSNDSGLPTSYRNIILSGIVYKY